MKSKLIVIGVLVIVFTIPFVAHAQTASDLIVLDDTAPAIDVVINPTPDTTGVVALEVNSASVTITDAAGNVVFETSAPDISALEFQFAPNAGTHTLTVERLPGATQGYSRIVSLSQMTVSNVAPSLVNGSVLAFSQEADYSLNASSPSSMVDFSISAADQSGAVTATFPGAPVTLQLADKQQGSVIATLNGGTINGVRFTLDSGDYQLVMLNNDPARQTVATVNLLPAAQSDFSTLVAQASPAQPAPASEPAVVSNPVNTACTMTITQSSVDLRSGPGTGYSVLGYAFRGDDLPVGGINPESGWLLVGTDAGSGWTSNTVGNLAGGCDNLTAYDTPYREAVSPQVSIQQSSTFRGEDDDRYEHEGGFEHEGFGDD